MRKTKKIEYDSESIYCDFCDAEGKAVCRGCKKDLCLGCGKEFKYIFLCKDCYDRGKDLVYQMDVLEEEFEDEYQDLFDEWRRVTGIW